MRALAAAPTRTLHPTSIALATLTLALPLVPHGKPMLLPVPAILIPPSLVLLTVPLRLRLRKLDKLAVLLSHATIL